jgi:hypothetical protein
LASTPKSLDCEGVFELETIEVSDRERLNSNAKDKKKRDKNWAIKRTLKKEKKISGDKLELDFTQVEQFLKNLEQKMMS